MRKPNGHVTEFHTHTNRMDVSIKKVVKNVCIFDQKYQSSNGSVPVMNRNHRPRRRVDYNNVSLPNNKYKYCQLLLLAIAKKMLYAISYRRYGPRTERKILQKY